MTRFLLNSAVITAPGDYRYRLIDVKEARHWYETPLLPHSEEVREKVQELVQHGKPISAIAIEMGIGKARVKTLIAREPDVVISTIGYAETAAALSELLSVEIPVDRRSITMEKGDEALVFRLVFPPGTPRIDPKDKGALGAALLAGHYELGLLRRAA